MSKTNRIFRSIIFVLLVFNIFLIVFTVVQIIYAWHLNCRGTVYMSFIPYCVEDINERTMRNAESREHSR